MQRKALRLFMFLAITAIVGMVTVQAYWFQKAFDIKQESFTLNVKMALNRVAQRIANYNEHQIPNGNLVEQLSFNSYQVLINQSIDATLLPKFIEQEFSKRQIIIDFEYAIYDCTSHSLNFGDVICMDGECNYPPTNQAVNPSSTRDQYYFLVRLPGSTNTLLASMDIWLFSTAVLFSVVLFFAYALFFILKQKRLSEIQKDFINNMSHEFQTPISSIILSGKTLLNPRTIESPSRISIYAKLICKEGERLKRNVESILEQADNDKYQLNTENTSMHELIKEAISAFKLIYPKSIVICQFDADKYHVDIDKLHMYNVIQNILNNCAKYSKKQATIEIKTYNNNDKLFLLVTDQGIGIGKKEQKLVFKKFYRVPHEYNKVKKGFGLGLYYTKKIIEAHKGVISLSSTLNKGTKVTLSMNLPDK